MFSNGACTMYTLRGGDVLTTDTASEGLAPAEHERLAALLQWWRDCGEPNTGHTSGARAVGSAITRGSTDCELGAVQEGQYFQLTGKVSHLPHFSPLCPLSAGARANVRSSTCS